MAQSAKDAMDMLKRRRADLKDAIPDVLQGFFNCLQSAEKDAALDHKTKELVTLGIAIAVRCDFCIAAHLDACLRAGATRQEIAEICGVAIAMGGGPSYTYAAYVFECLDELEGDQ